MPGQQTKLPAAKWALREKNEEAAILSPDNGRYKKSEARGASRMREFDEEAPKREQPQEGNSIAL